MNRFVQHIPNFVDGVEPVTQEFNTLDELLRIPCIAKWKEIIPQPNQFMTSADNLMIVTSDNTWWWVIGRVANPHMLGLPEWKHPKR